MSELLEEIKGYWGRRAESFSEGLFADVHVQNWGAVFDRELKVPKNARILDIGTGPGFFARLLAERGYDVTAVDYSPEMLEKAKENAGSYAERITFLQMDAQNLTFEDASFDAIVTRNITWNLEFPQQAYGEWYRVLKKDGLMLNFDAGWYEYLFDEEKKKEYEQDRVNVREAGCYDGASYSEAWHMEEISKQLLFSKCKRPQADFQMLLEAGFEKISVDTGIWREVWTKEEQVNYASTPCFMLKAVR